MHTQSALSAKKIERFHHEADILLNHVMDQNLDLARDLGCIIGKSPQTAVIIGSSYSHSKYFFLKLT
jgi:hypothetical protein